MDYISTVTREKLAATAKHRCEYCQTAQAISGGQMHIEHIIPESRGGTSDESNLCLSCAWCNSYKWAKIQGIDPQTQQSVPLFHPRQQQWAEHFRWHEDGVHVIGITPIGRATVEVLKMNNEFIVPARRLWVEAGWHPPIDDA